MGRLRRLPPRTESEIRASGLIAVMARNGPFPGRQPHCQKALTGWPSAVAAPDPAAGRGRGEACRPPRLDVGDRVAQVGMVQMPPAAQRGTRCASSLFAGSNPAFLPTTGQAPPLLGQTLTRWIPARKVLMLG